MIEVTQDVCRKADEHAAAVVEDYQRRAREQGTEPSVEIMFELHRAAWASVTGASAVKVVQSTDQSTG